MTTVTVTATGAGSFVIPSGVTSIDFEAWGAGGPAINNSTSNEAGGDGGDYISASISVTAGDTIYYMVGEGSVGGSPDSWFTKNVNDGTNGWKAGGGPNGSHLGVDGTLISAFTGGAPGASQGGGGSRAGGSGGGSAGPLGAGGAGAAGSGSTGATGGTGNGGNTAANTANVEGAGGASSILGNAVAGPAPGGGAAGARNSNTTTAAGGRGQIRYTYTVVGGSATMAAASASFVLTGKAATLKRSLSMSAASGSFAMTGKVAGLAKGQRLTAAATSFALAGAAAILKRALVLTADNGAQLVTNGSFGSATGWTLAGTPNPATISGGVLNIPAGNSSSALQPLPQSYPIGTSFAYSIDRLGTATGLGNIVFRFRNGGANADGVGLGGSGAATLSGIITITLQATVDTLGVTANGVVSGSFDNLSVSLITYSFAGTAVTFTRGRALAAAAGAYSLTGTAANLNAGRKLTAAGASFAMTGSDATLSKEGLGYTMVAESSKPNLLSNPTFDANTNSWAGTGATVSWISGGRMRVTRTDVGYCWGRQNVVTATIGQAYVWGAQFSNPSPAGITIFAGTIYEALTASNLSSAASGLVFGSSINGGAGGGLDDQLALGMDNGDETIGNFVEFDNAYYREVEFKLAGTAAALATGKSMAAVAAVFNLTGAAASLIGGTRLTAAAGSYAVTGAAASFQLGRRFIAAAGTYAMTGKAATLARGRAVAAASASFALTGTAASFVVTRRLTAAPASFLLTGTNAALISQGILVALAGGYTITGAAALLSVGKKLAAGGGSFILTGANALFVVSLGLAAGAAAFTITGTSAGYILTGQQFPTVGGSSGPRVVAFVL